MNLEKLVKCIKTLKEHENVEKSKELSKRHVRKGTTPPPFEKAPTRQNPKFSASELSEGIDSELDEVTEGVSSISNFEDFSELGVDSEVDRSEIDSDLKELMEVSPILLPGKEKGAQASTHARSTLATQKAQTPLAVPQETSKVPAGTQSTISNGRSLRF